MSISRSLSATAIFLSFLFTFQIAFALPKADSNERDIVIEGISEEQGNLFPHEIQQDLIQPRQTPGDYPIPDDYSCLDNSISFFRHLLGNATDEDEQDFCNDLLEMDPAEAVVETMTVT